LSEFDLIRRFFSRCGASRADVSLGVGDDCALLRLQRGMDLAVSIDTLAGGVHFFADCDPEGLGHKCLAVGLSDLAAMGAEPAWATLALTLPGADERWLAGFSRGFCSLAAAHGVSLVGGDTTRGPLSITVQVHGSVPSARAVTRDGAGTGDLVCVSGILGEAGLALRLLRAGEPVPQHLRERLERPNPRVELGLALRGLATAMIDISDGLAADLGHILEASGVGAEIQLGTLPLSAEVASVVEESGDWGLPMASGDDYELCFTLPPERRGELFSLASRCACDLSVIGSIDEGQGLGCVLPNGGMWRPRSAGYDHLPG